MEKELNRIKHLMGLGDKKKVKTLHINETTKIKYLNGSSFFCIFLNKY